MKKERLSVCDAYRAEMVSILGSLGRDEALFEASKGSKGFSAPELGKRLRIAESIASQRKALASLFFVYLLEDEYD